MFERTWRLFVQIYPADMPHLRRAVFLRCGSETLTGDKYKKGLW